MALTASLHEFLLSGFCIVDQNLMDGYHLIVTCTLHNQGNVIKFQTLIECGATGYAFIDEDYAHHHHLPLHLLKSPRNLTLIDRQPVTSGAITHITCTRLAIRNHQEDIFLFMTMLRYYSIVLGIP
jgi:predicted aspartyl protease